MKQLLSPKQVAASVGVSESSLKRWCDQGLIPIERTPGGHRRIHLRDAIQFVRDRGDRVVMPEKLGLPDELDTSSHKPAEAVASLVRALRAGDQEAARRTAFNCYLGGALISEICDDLITPAMHQVGRDWECGQLEVFKERRACELISRVLYDLGEVAPRPGDEPPIAIGGSPEGDHYQLATKMVALSLTEIGWEANSLGTCLPIETLAAAALEQQPAILWLSVSHCGDSAKLSKQIVELAGQIPAKTRLILGGQAIPAGLDTEAERIVACQNLRSLQQIARTLAG